MTVAGQSYKSWFVTDRKFNEVIKIGCKILDVQPTGNDLHGIVCVGKEKAVITDFLRQVIWIKDEKILIYVYRYSPTLLGTPLCILQSYNNKITIA